VPPSPEKPVEPAPAKVEMLLAVSTFRIRLLAVSAM